MYTIYKDMKLHNVAELEFDEERGGYRMPRLPLSVVKKMHEKGQKSIYFNPGCELRFQMISDEVRIHIKRDLAGANVMPTGIAEVWQGDYQGRYELGPQIVGNEESVLTIRRTDRKFIDQIINEKHLYSPELYRVILPYDYSNVLIDYEGEVALPGSGMEPERTLLCYGSSITHGSCAFVGSESYAAKLATGLGMDLRNLGVAGASYMEEAVAHQIANETWDMATLELGINVVDCGWTQEEFVHKAATFIENVCAGDCAKAGRPVYVISPFFSKKDGMHPEILAYMRPALEQIVTQMNLPNLHYINGLDCLHDSVDLSSDGLHPASRGMTHIAEEILRIL